MRNALQVVGFLALVVLGTLVVLETQSVLGGGPPQIYRKVFNHEAPAPVAMVLWCVDDDGRIVPLAPQLVRRGRILRFPIGWVPK